MAQPRIYFAGQLSDGATVILTGTAANHLSRVLRLDDGTQVILFNGDGREHVAWIDSRSRSGLKLRVGGGRQIDRESPLRVILLQGICRGQRMDLVIQKATEMGVAEIRPVACERSVVKLAAERADRRMEHWQAVVVGAAEQCGRTILPQLITPVDLEAALSDLPANARRISLDPAASLGIREAAGNDGPIVLLAGPEGGLSEGERRLVMAAGFQAVRLGPRIMRTETAPLAALSVLQFLRGDLAGN